jgi:hypothetical protein
MKTRKMYGAGFSLLLFAASQLSAAVSGCNNGFLLGNYNAAVSNLNLQSTLQTLSGNGGTVTPAGSTTGTAVIGFSGNPRSLSGSAQGTSRFYFDGNGIIVGSGVPTGGTVAVTMQAGSYTVNSDCSATMTLIGGASFDAVVAAQGKQVLFVETDSANLGAIGTLQKTSSCVSLSYPQSFAFSFFGSSPASTSSTGGTTGTTGGTTGTTGGTTGTTGGTGGTTTASFGAYSQLGTLSTDGTGNFLFTQTTISNGAVNRSKGGGTYTVGQDCSLKLSFAANAPGTTANFLAPLSISGLTTDSSGGVLVQQPNATTSPLTGTFVVQ